MSRLNPMPLSVALLAVVAVGCKDSTTDPGEPLSPREAEALHLGLLSLVNDSTTVISMTPDGSVLACPLGGQVIVVANSSEETSGDTTRFAADISLDPDRCVVSSEGWEFTLDGNPSFRFAMTFSFAGSNSEFLLDGTTTGGVDWELDDRSGTCMFDLMMSGGAVRPALSEPQLFATATGTMCGLEVDGQTIRVPGS